MSFVHIVVPHRPSARKGHPSCRSKKIKASALLLSTALVASGCKTVPQSPSTHTGDSDHRLAIQDEYNRTYQTEAHHRHHHGKRNQVDDAWTGYDRAETTNERFGSRSDVANLPGQTESQSGGGNSLPGAHTSHQHSSLVLTAAPGRFDYYVLNLSWSPEFCHQRPGAAECVQHRAFTLHGLWPQNQVGTYPEDCSQTSGPANPSQYVDIYPDPALLRHEWQVHGTCSGLEPDRFFALARRAEQSIHIPAQLSDLTQQTTLTPAQLVTLLMQSNPGIPASSLAISCGNNYLAAVEICLDKDLKPEGCSSLKTCRANRIAIPAPR